MTPPPLAAELSAMIKVREMNQPASVAVSVSVKQVCFLLPLFLPLPLSPLSLFIIQTPSADNEHVLAALGDALRVVMKR